ncbi:hypothetical protein BGZ83_004915 [Gryganskiella cystojenkinii]|nr:hypothetical protein BGZ83_004915 [Gryganskiella cystojenkinii]
MGPIKKRSTGVTIVKQELNEAGIGLLASCTSTFAENERFSGIQAGNIKLIDGSLARPEFDHFTAREPVGEFRNGLEMLMAIAMAVERGKVSLGGGGR